MSWIRTTSGLVSAESIGGTTLAHEHLAIDLRRGEDQAATLLLDQEITDELRGCREAYGLSLVVELTCRGMGRDVARVHQMAKAAGIHAVTSSGYYYEAFHRSEVGELSVDELTDSLVAEIETGSDGTSIRPGVLGEIGSHGLEPSVNELKSLRAAGFAAGRTGLSVATHAHLGQGGLGQLEILTATGLAPERISIGHQDLCDDGAQHRSIAAAGAYVAFDTVGKVSYQSDEQRLRLLLDLIEAGHANKVLMSNDISRDPYLVVNGGTGFGHVLGAFAQMLRDAGVDEPTMDLLYRKNLLDFLTAGELAGPEEI